MHFFYVPVTSQRVVKPKVREGGLAALSEHAGENGAASTEDEIGEGRPVQGLGMTARILVDAATIAYGEQPEFASTPPLWGREAHRDAGGDREDGEKKRNGSALTAEEVKKAYKCSRRAGGRAWARMGRRVRCRGFDSIVAVAG